MFFEFDFTLFDQEVAAHTEVNEEAEIRQTEDEIFGTARNTLDELPLNRLSKFSRRWKCKRASPAQLRALDRFFDQLGFELAYNRFDFREFGHIFVCQV